MREMSLSITWVQRSVVLTSPCPMGFWSILILMAFSAWLWVDADAPPLTTKSDKKRSTWWALELR